MKYRTPLPPQDKALAYALPRKRIALFMEMRLGKTLVAIRWAELKKPGNVLVLCPKSVVPTWSRELKLEGVECAEVVGAQKEKMTALNMDVRWFVTNYQTLFMRDENGKAVPNALAEEPWDVVIIDESTVIRSPTAKITQLCIHNFSHVEYRAILSGLPNPESDLDFFSQMRFLYGGAFMGYLNYYEFRDEYFIQGYNGWDWLPRRGSSAKIYDHIRTGSMVMTRKEAGLGSRKIYEERYVTIPEKIMRAYRKAEEEFVLGDKETTEEVGVLTWLARLTGGAYPEFTHNAKFRELCYLLDGELKHEQVVVWFRFNSEIAVALDTLGADAASVTGKMSERARRMAFDHFRDGKVRILLVQARVAQFGVDLSCASTAIYFSRYYDGEVNAQSMDRIISPAKTEPVLIIDLLAKHTIDEDIIKLVRGKKLKSRMFMSQLVRKVKSRWPTMKLR